MEPDSLILPPVSAFHSEFRLLNSEFDSRLTAFKEEQGVEATLRLMERLEHLGIFYVPLLFVSEEGTTFRGRRHQEADQLGTLHWDVCFRCWRYNLVNWSPGFYHLARLAECFSMKWRVRALFTAFAASKSMERGKRRTRLRKKVAS